MTYWNQMTAEVGHITQHGYKLGDVLPNKLYVDSVPLMKKKRPYEKW